MLRRREEFLSCMSSSLECPGENSYCNIAWVKCGKFPISLFLKPWPLEGHSCFTLQKTKTHTPFIFITKCMGNNLSHWIHFLCKKKNKSIEEKHCTNLIITPPPTKDRIYVLIKLLRTIFLMINLFILAISCFNKEHCYPNSQNETIPLSLPHATIGE